MFHFNRFASSNSCRVTINAVASFTSTRKFCSKFLTQVTKENSTQTMYFAVILCAILMVFVSGQVKYERRRDWTDFPRYITSFICGENNREADIYSVYNGGHTSSHYKIISFENRRFHEIVHNFSEIFDNSNTSNISGTELKTFEIKACREAMKLKMLLASNNRLTHISSNLFGNAVQIEFVNFSNNFMQRNHPTAFEGVNHLKTLNLSYNELGKCKIKSLSFQSFLT